MNYCYSSFRAQHTARVSRNIQVAVLVDVAGSLRRRHAEHVPLVAAELIGSFSSRSQPYRSRFSRPNTHFSAFFEIYTKIIFSQAKSCNSAKKFANFVNFLQDVAEFCKNCFREDDFLVDLEKC